MELVCEGTKPIEISCLTGIGVAAVPLLPVPPQARVEIAARMAMNPALARKVTLPGAKGGREARLL